jgi:probable O-glycosylation ligase (exosortase A-associated)
MWLTFLKTVLMATLIPMLFHRKEDIRLLLWVIVLSIAYFGTKGGLWVLLTGGGERVFGPPGSYIQDNNALAAALITMIPLMRYLLTTSPSRNVRWGMVAATLLCIVSVVGSYSRGALLGAIAMLAFLWLKGKRKLPILVVGLLSIPPILMAMPDKWFARMDTLGAYQEDGSASARLNSWRTMLNIANDRPLVGGGFVVDEPTVYQRYSPEPDVKAHVAHSIYFQALGEHGYVGLFLYLLLFFHYWRKAGWIIRSTAENAELAWARDLAAMLQVTFVGFAVSGAFLSLVNFDVPYYLIMLLVAMHAVVERELKLARPALAGAKPGARFARIDDSRLPRPRGG